MSVKTIQAKLECDRETLETLWRTHTVFNEGLLPILALFFKMKRRETGSTEEEKDLYKRICEFILRTNASNPGYLLNSVCLENWKPDSARKTKAEVVRDGKKEKISAEEWIDDLLNMKEESGLLFLKQELLNGLPIMFFEKLVAESKAILSAYEELQYQWEVDHNKWLKEKEGWEKKHKEYLAVRSLFQKFEQEVKGKITKKRRRWHLYKDWMKRTPELVAWRGKETKVYGLTEEDREAIKKAPLKKKIGVEVGLFFKRNPELSALDKLHSYYEEKFVRRGKKKRNCDGYEHRPTFTLPHSVKHPRWYVFSGPQTGNGYKNLNIPERKKDFGQLDLLVLTDDKVDGEYPREYRTVKFRGDHRFLDIRGATRTRLVTKGKNKGQEVEEKFAYEMYDRYLKIWRPLKISGAKLAFRDIKINQDGSLKSAVPYLWFTLNLEDLPISEKAKEIKWVETDEVKDNGDKRKKIQIPEGLITCAVNIGIRNLGFGTLAVGEKGKARILRSRNIWIGEEEKTGKHKGRWQKGPTLRELRDHKQEIRRLRKLRGKVVKGERSHIKLQNHITNFADDRLKKAARKILNFALNVENHIDKKTGKPYPRADVLLLEDLSTLVPTTKKRRDQNQLLIEFMHRGTLSKIEEMAKDAGLKVLRIKPGGISQVCPKCGGIGRRYEIRIDQETKKPDIHFTDVIDDIDCQKLFVCASCSYRGNGDHVASVNLHRKFYDWSVVDKYFTLLRSDNYKEQKKVIEEELREFLRKEHFPQMALN